MITTIFSHKTMTLLSDTPELWMFCTISLTNVTLSYEHTSLRKKLFFPTRGLKLMYFHSTGQDWTRDVSRVRNDVIKNGWILKGLKYGNCAA